MLTRIPSSPPIISPVYNDSNRPLWSVMIPVYNCSNYLEETLESVLLQDIPEEEMQIEVIDDYSTDADVEALVKEVGQGRVKYFRQTENVGSLRNFETCINRATGELVHILHGDDRVREGYYKGIKTLFNKYPDAGAAFSGYRYIDEKGKNLYDQTASDLNEGILKNWLYKIAVRQRIQYVAITVKRDVYEKLGAFYSVTYAEDWEMWVRIAKNYPVAYTPEILAEYRKHEGSISGQKFINALYIDDLLYIMDLIQQHLPDALKKTVLKQSHQFYSHYAIRTANTLWHSSHNKEAVKANVKKALAMHKDLFLLFKIAKLYTKIIINRR